MNPYCGIFHLLSLYCLRTQASIHHHFPSKDCYQYISPHYWLIIEVSSPLSQTHLHCLSKAQIYLQNKEGGTQWDFETNWYLKSSSIEKQTNKKKVWPIPFPRTIWWRSCRLCSPQNPWGQARVINICRNCEWFFLCQTFLSFSKYVLLVFWKWKQHMLLPNAVMRKKSFSNAFALLDMRLVCTRPPSWV